MLSNAFTQQPQETQRIETPYRRIVTPLPVPESLKDLEAARRVFPQVNCYQTPMVWDRADGYQVLDAYGNCWIDFSSTAVMANSGHGHPAVRAALLRHVEDGLLAQFSFASKIRVQLAERLLQLAPSGMEKVYFWTTGSEAIESAYRLVSQWGQTQHPQKRHVLSMEGDYHGCTLLAHQLSGPTTDKPWLPEGNALVHRLPFPDARSTASGESVDWEAWLHQGLEKLPCAPDPIAAIFIETLQGWGALPLDAQAVQVLRRWADEHDVLLVFDEIQTGFGRTGRWFAHEHYNVRADLICLGKGVTSSLPLAAVLGPADVLDVIPPGEVTTTHAGHPLSCAAALANLDVLENENLIAAAQEKGTLVRTELQKLQQRHPRAIHSVTGLGLLNAIHLCDPTTGQPSRELARDLTFEAVRRGVMLFQTNQPTVKICPPLVIPPEAVSEGISALGEALDSILN